MDVDEKTLDRANCVDPFVLALAGNLEDAEDIQQLIDNNKPDEAADYYKRKAGIQ